MHNRSNGNELRILIQIQLISLIIVEHRESLRNRDKQKFGKCPIRKLRLHGQLEKERTEEIKMVMPHKWVTKRGLKRETKSLLIAPQDQALNRNSGKRDVYNMG